MGQELIVTGSGQVVLPETLIAKLGFHPGQKIEAELGLDGRIELRLSDLGAGDDLSRLQGILARPGQRRVSLEEMQQAIETAQFSCE